MNHICKISDVEPDKQAVSTEMTTYGIHDNFPQISHHSNVVMEALRVSVLDIDGKKFMFDKMREHLKFSPSIPDGHCFLYSVIKACSTQLAPNLHIEVESILDKMHSELATFPNVYTGFTEGKDIGEMMNAFDDYALHKKYDTYLGDTVPLLCANALGINIIVLNDSRKDRLSKIIFTKKSSNVCVFVYKRGDHYDGLIPMEHICDHYEEPLWQSGHTHDINVFNENLLSCDKSVDTTILSLTNDDDTEDSPDDFIYRLKMHRKSNPTNLTAGFLNINSIRNKFSALQHILCNSYVDLLGISETKLDDTFPHGQFHVDNYVLNRKDRTSHGGGVALYVRSDIPHRRRHDLENIIDSSATGLEIIIIEATLRKKERWIYIVGYKPPGIKDTAFYDVFSTMCDLVIQESENVVVLGDYNCDFMVDNPLKDICETFDLQNLVNDPTCFKNQKGSLIDLCLVSNPSRFKKALNLNCWLSDWHNFICVTTKLFAPHQKPSVIMYRSFKNFIDDYFICDLYHMLESLNSDKCDGINTCFQTFIDCLNDIVNFHAPLKTKTIRKNNVPYMNSEWRKMMYKRNMMRNIKNKHPCPENYDRYRNLRNQCVKIGKRSKKQYFAERCEGGPKNQHFWATIKPFISPRHYANIDIMLSENNSIITESESVAKIFNKYFNEIAEGIGFNDPIPENFDKDDILLSMIKRYDDHPSIMAIKSFCTQGQSFDFIHVTPNDIKSCIVNLDSKKSTGYDGIPVKLLKVGTEPLSVMISKLINLSIDECTFPDLLKYAEMAALFKKLDRLCKENYRPVSILTALSKVFEKIYCRQLTSYFDRIFSKYLSGFRQKYSCQSTLLRMIEEWKSALDNGNMVGSIAIDLSRAFDSLPHGLLLAKIYAYGVNIESCKLIASYLHNRHHRVKIRDKRSDWLQIERGVPQGSIMGPLLFNIFINDIFLHSSDIDIYNYADDNCISFAGNSIDVIEDTLNKEIISLMEWFRKNSLAANPAKFQTMLVKSNSIKDTELNVTADNVSLPSSDTMKVLGIDIDARLTFDGHVSNMCIKAGKQLNALQRLKGSLDQDSRMAIYKSFIMSNFNYCPLIWMFTSKTSLSKLENIQKRALRFVLNDYQSGYTDLLHNAKVPGIKIMVLRYLAIEVFKCVKEISPAYLNAMFIRKECPYALRDNSILVRPKVNRTQYGLKSFKSYGAKIWNNLPTSFKANISLDEFKTIIKSWDGPKCKCSVCDLYT